MMTHDELYGPGRRYCANCWESLTQGQHRLDQVCQEPSEPLTYGQLGVVMGAQMTLEAMS